MLTKKQFAELAGMPTNALAVYVRRNKITVAADGRFDPDLPQNAAFLLKHGAKPETKPPAKQAETEEPDELPSVEVSQEGLIPYEKVDHVYQTYRALRNKAAFEQAELEIAKKKGEYIPTEIVKQLFSKHNQSVITEMRNMLDAELRQIAKQHDLSVDQVAATKGRLIDALNEATDNARKSTAKEVKAIVTDYIKSK